MEAARQLGSWMGRPSQSSAAPSFPNPFTSTEPVSPGTSYPFTSTNGSATACSLDHVTHTGLAHSLSSSHLVRPTWCPGAGLQPQRDVSCRAGQTLGSACPAKMANSAWAGDVRWVCSRGGWTGTPPKPPGLLALLRRYRRGTKSEVRIFATSRHPALTAQELKTTTEQTDAPLYSSHAFDQRVFPAVLTSDTARRCADAGLASVPVARPSPGT
jgi:hypothetical protein